MNEYLHTLGYLMGVSLSLPLNDPAYLEPEGAAEELYNKLLEQMRADTLGWTAFGLWERLHMYRRRISK